MVNTTYRTGPWIGIVRSGSVIVLEASTDPAVVTALWEYLGRDTPTIHGVLNAVTSHFGTDLTGMPQFGILVHSDRLHVILRGGISLAVQTAGAADTVSGRDVATWSERSLALTDSLVLTLDAEGAAEGASPALPLGEAVVLLSELSQGLPVSGGAVFGAAGSGDAASRGTAADGAVFGAAGSVAARAGTAGAFLGSHDAGTSPSLGTGGLSVAGDVSAGASGTGFASGTGSDPSIGSGHFVNPESGTSVGDGLESGSAAETEGAGHGRDTRDDGTGEDSQNAGDAVGLGGVGHGAPENKDTGLRGSGFESRDSASAGFDSSRSDSADSDSADQHNSDSDSTDSDSADQHNSDSDSADHDSATHDEADLGDTIHGGAADAAGDEDAYAGFALAADAEWNAELAEAPGTDPDSGDGSAVESVDGGPHWQSSADEGDLGQTIYPHLGFDDDEPAVSSSGAGESGVGEEIDDSAEAAGFHGITGSGAVSEPDGVDPAEDGNTTDYDHLFGATELRSVEDAAIRLDENGHELPKEATGQVAANIPPQPPMPPIAGQRIDGGDGDVAEGDSASSAEESAPAPAWQPPSGLLIDSVPWGNSSTGGPPASPQVTADADTAGDPDHDGHTVMRSALAGEAPVAEPLESRPPTGPMVLARLCPAGHANPPSRSQCSECGAAIDSEPREVGRPRLGRMHISTGDVLDLDHSLVIGRQPSVSRVMGGVMPRLVQVHSASGDISRSHVEVRLDGWDVLLVDLKATNGTVLVREGQAPRRLGQGEQAILLNGDIAELGDGVSLLFEGLL